MADADESMALEHWRPTEANLEEIQSRCTDHETGQVKAISWEEIRKEIDQRIADAQSRRDRSRPGIDQALKLTETLEAPEQRLRLIAQLWASMPVDHWAAPTENELRELERRLADPDADALAIVPWTVLRRMRTNRPDPIVVRSKIYSAPRRFDLATIFAVMSAYSLLFASMARWSFPPLASLMVGGFITIVGIAQALLFGGRKPRTASMLTGAGLFFCGTLLYEPRMYAPLWIVLAVTGWTILGGFLGYLAGTLVGGVFLVADGLRKMFERLIKRNAEVTPEAEAT